MASNSPLDVPAEQQRKALVAAGLGFATGFIGVMASGGGWKAALLAGLSGAVAGYAGVFKVTNEKAPE